MDIKADKVFVENKDLNSSKNATLLKDGEKSFKDELSDLKSETVSEKNDSSVLANESQTDPCEALSKTIVQMASPLHQSDDIQTSLLNKSEHAADTSIENPLKENGLPVLNNDMNLNKSQELLPELRADINFAQQGGEAFSSFLEQSNSSLAESAEEIQEDNNILSTMAENQAIVNKVVANIGVRTVDEVGVVVDRVINASEINLSRNDIQLLLNLVNSKLDMSEVAKNEDTKFQSVSEVFNSMLLDSMKNGKAFRLNFDNDISVIIKVSREGRISANFLPGTDIAENYLRNNMANLVRRFAEEGIPYDELNHQKHKRDNEQHNKKDKKDE